MKTVNKKEKELMPVANWRTYDLPETYVKCMCGWTGYFTQTDYYECSHCKRSYEIDSKINFKKISEKRYSELLGKHMRFQWDWGFLKRDLNISSIHLSETDKLKYKVKQYEESYLELRNILKHMMVYDNHSELNKIQYIKSIENLMNVLDKEIKQYDEKKLF